MTPSRKKNIDNACLWAITAHFNPMNYECRLRNYRIFRQQLAVPLVTVELGYAGKFELQPGDADVLLQIRAHSVLWQKERLLNVALTKVPKHVKFIAWLDCDIIFDSERWVDQTMQQLKSVSIVQAFSEVCRLERGVLPGCAPIPPNVKSRKSSACLINNIPPPGDDPHRLSAKHLRQGCAGYAWAARRELLDQHGFYDGLIIGGGDLAMACAAYGRFEEAINATRLDGRRAAHFLAWGRPFFDQVGGRVGCVEGRIYHLWHGDTANRQYEERHKAFAGLHFDPFVDIILTKQGSWMLAKNKEALESYLRNYFASRREDG